MSPSETTEFLPSIAQILKRADALARVSGVDVQSVAGLPVFSGRAWKHSIAEFLRWSGTTPDPGGATSVFELLLCHGSEGARAIVAAYQEDRIERAETFAEAASQLEAVRTVISMASHWLHAIPWDLRGVPRLTPENFRARPRVAIAPPREGIAGVAKPRISELVEKFLREEVEPRRRASSSVPVFPNDPASPNLWKDVSPRSRKPPEA
ncbi:MAG TPA: hypothetical protein VIA45_08500 [Thermoanaerobaculia bacterium]|jgi:hypothetical protein